MIQGVLCFLIVSTLAGIILVVRAAKKAARERRLDANTLYVAERVVECGHRCDRMRARCIKLRGHVEAGDPNHMFYEDADDRDPL